MKLKIVRNDITKMNVEAIVNPANSAPTYGSGLDEAIYRAAGEKELLALRDRIGYVNAGQAFITPGLALPAGKIIHTVSPRYLDGKSGEEELLRRCYRNVCAIAQEEGIRELALPVLGIESLGYNLEEGMRIALDELEWELRGRDMTVCLVICDKETEQADLGQDLEKYIDSHYVDARKQAATGPAPERLMAEMPVVQTKRRGSVFGGGLFSSRRGASGRAYEESMPEAAAMFSKGAGLPLAEELSVVESREVVSCAAPDPEIISAALADRMEHMSDSFQQYLFYLIERKGMSNSEVYKRGIIDKRLFAKIKADANYHPKKITAMQLCVGLMLNLDETKDLLARAGYALSPCDKTDVIFSYFIENKVYDMIEIDIQLEEHGLPCLIA